MPLGVNGDAYLPLPVPVWGQMNNGALLVNAHMNFLFHAERNYVIGAGAYAGACSGEGHPPLAGAVDDAHTPVPLACDP